MAMSAVFTGNGLGLWSAHWGSAGGDARLGRGADSQYVNLATGNLLLQTQDEQLVFRGLAVSHVRTYNSQGQLEQVGADAWLTGFERRIELISGALNQAGSIVRRHTGDGAVQDFVLVAPNQYQSTSGDGAHDTLRWSETSRTWSFVEGTTRREEGYADHEDTVLLGRLTHIRSLVTDATEPTTWIVAYDAQQRIAEVRAQDGTAQGDALVFDYDAAGRLSGVSTREGGILRGQVGYGYDAVGRLTTVLVDLAPDDVAGDVDIWDAAVAANNDGRLFRTDYTYTDATSLRISRVTQSDGTLASYTYDAQGRIATVTRGDSNADDSDGLGQTLSFTYDAINRRTDVIDSAGHAWTYVHDAAGQLVRVESPAREGLRDVTLYTYDAAGNVTQVVSERGGARLSQIDYQYDDRGNPEWEWHVSDLAAGAAARAIRRTYTAGNQVASETLFIGLDADGAGSAQLPAGGLTTHYVYDAQDRLRFAVDAEGGVRELEYATTGSGIGQVSRSRQYLGAAYTGDHSLAALLAWATDTRKSQSTLQESSYDLQGRLAAIKAYAAVDAQGHGIEDDTAAITGYVYDAQGLLRQQVVQRSSTATENDGRDSCQVTTYTYDGMGRLLSEVISEQMGGGPVAVLRTTAWSYLDSAMMLKAVIEGGMAGDGQANDLLRTQAYDAAGRIVATTESAMSGGPVHITQNYYDGRGLLRATEDAGGARTWFFYGAEGELSGQVDATGALSRYWRDAAGRVISSRTYSTRVDTTGWLVAGQVLPEEIAAVSPASTSNDREITTTYDADGRTLTQTDGEDGVVHHIYDGAGRLVETRKTDAAQTMATVRSTRHFYDGVGRLVGQLDAEGYLVEYTYDLAGRRTRTTAYAIATSEALRASGTLEQLRPVADPSDQQSRVFYDGRGNTIAVLDAEGYLSEYAFDEARNERGTRAYSKKLIGLDGSETLATLRAMADAGEVRETRRAFDALGNLVIEVNPEGAAIRHTYDAQGRLLKSQSDYGGSEVRDGNRRYDVFGNLIGELGGEGSARLLPGMSEAELDGIYAQYGVRHVYDVLGRRIESIDALGNKTWYIHDGTGRLTHTVRGMHDALGIANAEAEVSETRYTAFGEVRETIAFTGRVMLAAPGDRASVLAAVSTLMYQANVDSRSQLTYDRRGRVTERIDAEGHRTSFVYNAFGDLVGQSVQTQAMQTLETIMSYDRRGLRTSQVADPGGLSQGTTWTFDAFGRAVTATDGRGNVSEFSYDRLGRQIAQARMVGGRLEQTGIAYDAFGRVASRTDAYGNLTTYAYDDAGRSVEVTTPEGVVLLSEHNAHGETVRVTDGTGVATAYVYDLDGRLLETIDAADDEGYGLYSTREYDSAGRLALATDATGRSIAYQYDAVGRVLSRIVDPDGLALTTRYAYDGQGRQISTTDPGGVVTTMRYDGNGQLLETVQDAGGLNLRTTYAWDARGLQLSVTEAAGTADSRTTAYAYDVLGRRISETSDAGAGRMNLVTAYAYDANDNLVASTDAAGRTTRFTYDAANRRTFSVDGAGGVVRTWYDANGHAVGTRAYAQAIAVADLPPAVAEADLLARITPDDSRDMQQYVVYDGDGRALLSIDGAGAVTERFYDGAGRVTETRTYAHAAELDGSLRTTLLAGLADTGVLTSTRQSDDAHDRVNWTIYDSGTGRAVVTVDNAGTVVETIHDNAGRIVETIAYADRVDVSALTPGLLREGGASAYWEIQYAVGSSSDRQQSMAYDGAGRLAYTLTRNYADYIEANRGWGNGGNSGGQDPDGAIVQQMRYDASGRVVAVVRYASTAMEYYAPEDSFEPDEDGLNYSLVFADKWLERDLDCAGVLEGGDRTTRYAYDAVGRLRFTLAADGAISEQRFNAVGDRIESISYGVRMDMVSFDEAAFVAAVLNETDVHRNQMHYDTAGRMTETINAAGGVESFGYDATGLLTSYSNRDGHVWTYQYDDAGRRVAEFSPKVDVASVGMAGVSSTDYRSIVTRLQYDALGNVVVRSEDADGAAPRVVHYSYDNRGHQVATLLADAGKVDHTTGVIGQGDGPVSIEITYDTLGRAVAQKDARGFYSYKSYDSSGRVAYEIDQEGYVTGYVYTAFGEQCEMRRYANRIEGPIGEAPDTDAVYNLLSPDEQQDRVILTSYDTRGNTVSVLQGMYGHPVYSEYDAYGQLVHTARIATLQSEAVTEAWAHTYYYYDSAGRQDLTLDAEGYVTAMTYDAYGQLSTKTEYARALPLHSQESSHGEVPWGLDRYSPDERPSLPASGDATTGYDRVYRYGYDALGRKISETIARHYRDADGNSGVRDVVTSSEYDNEGHVLRLVVDGQATETAYDALGRTVSVKESARDALVSNHVGMLESDTALALGSAALYRRTSPYSTLAYDAFGNVVELRRYANGWGVGQTQPQASTHDLVQQSRYDGQGRLVWERDTLGTVHTKHYDAADNLLEDRSRLDNGNGTWSIIINKAQYDHVGRQIISMVSRDIHAADGSLLGTHTDTATQVRYNGFGEMVAKDNRIDLELSTSEFAAQYEYDTRGDLVRTNANGRGWEEYRYDIAGVRSGEYRPSWDGNWVSGNYTDFGYDRLGRQTYQHESENSYHEATRIRYDRWGNVLSIVDARGGRTTRQYNELNQLVREERPDVAVLHADGTTTRERPVYSWFYDAAGNLLGTRDGNGNIRRNHYDASGRLVESEDAYRNVTSYAYDAFDQRVLTRNALGYITFREYDLGGRVVAVGDFLANASGSTRTRNYRETYLLNQNGDRLRVTDALGNAASYEYDSRGLVLRSRTSAGLAMEYAYDLQGNKVRETNGLADGALVGGAQPVYAGGLVGQTVLVDGQTLSLLLPAGAFTVPNGESPAISVLVERYDGANGYTPVNGMAWNAATRTLEGVLGQEGSYRITFMGSSSTGAVAAAYATVLVVSQATWDASYAGRPYAAQGFPVLTPALGQGFSYTLPQGSFVDPQGQALTYEASVSVIRYVYDVETRRSLPEVDTIVLGPAATSESWLTFDPLTGTIAGTPPNGAVVMVSISARDPDGNVAHQTLTVKPNSGSARTRMDREGELVRLDEQTWDYDYFGRVIDHNDLSGFDYDYVYNEETGQLIAQSSDWTQAARQYSTPLAAHWTQAQWMEYGLSRGDVELDFPEPVLLNDPSRTMSYYSSGKLRQMTEGNNWYRYQYDASGNRTVEESYTIDANGQVLHLRTEIRYDLQNRMTRVTQHDQIADRRLVDVRYGYDANGNRVRVQTYNGYDPTSPDINVVENNAPELKWFEPPMAYVGHFWSYEIPASAITDRDGDAVYLEILDLPEWLSFDAATRTLSGTPPREERVWLQLRASDMDNAFDVISFTIQCVEDNYLQGSDRSTVVAYGDDGFFIASNGYLFEYPYESELTFELKAGSGGPLPSWVHLVDGQVKFDWKALPAGVNAIDLLIQATSPTGNVASATLAVEFNQPPQWIGDVVFAVQPDVPWSMQIDSSLFSDLEGDEIEQVYLSWGPNWLSWDSSTRTLSGTPPLQGSTNSALGVGRWTVGFDVYSRGQGVQVGIILDTSSAIVAAKAVPQQVLAVNSSFQVQLPQDLFDHRAGLSMTYEARLIGVNYRPSGYLWGGSYTEPTFSQSYSVALPSWLQFDAANMTLGGTAPGVSDHFIVEVTARDANGNSATKLVLVTVSDQAPNPALPATTRDGLDLAKMLSKGASSLPLWRDTVGVERSTDTTVPRLAQDVRIVYTAGQAFSFTIPDSFLRGNPADVVAMYMQSALPSGVTFDPATRTFSGTITNGSVSEHTIFVVDSSGVVSSGVVRFVADAYPASAGTYHGGLQDQSAQVGKAFEYTPPTGAFATTGTQALVFQAQIARLGTGFQQDPLARNLLPAFSSLASGEYSLNSASNGLVFDPSSGKVSGCPLQPGTYLIRVTASGAAGYFVLTVAEGTYNAPVAGPAVLEVPRLTLGQPWSFQLPANLRVDPDGGPLVYLTPRGQNSTGSLPSWLQFDKATGTFSGTPTTTDAVYLYVPVRTTDGEVSDIYLILQVNQPVQAPQAFNSDFERGDTGWDKGNGFSIVQGGDAYSGSWSAKFTGHATASIVNTQRVPVRVGQTVTASCMVQQGASSAGDASGAVVLHWYDANGTLLGWDVGNIVNSGSNGNWHKSSITMQVPPGAAYMAIGGAANKQTNHELWLDRFEWNFQQLERDTSTISTPQTYWYAYDAENRVTVVNGKLENGQVVLANENTSFALDYDAGGRAVRRSFLDGANVKEELTQYDERGQRIVVFQARSLGSNQLVVGETFSYDAAGRQTKHRQYDEYGAMKHLDSTVYDADGRTLSQSSFGRSLDGTGYGEWADGEGLSLIGKIDYGAYGYDEAGRLRGYSYHAARHEVGSGATAQDPIGFVHRYVFQYEGRDSYLEKQVYGSSSNGNFRASSSLSTYDAWGRRTAVREQTPLASNLGTLDDRIRYFSYDGEGNVLRRLEGTLVSGGRFNQTIEQVDQTQRYAYVNGQQIASGKYNGEFDVIGKLTAYNTSEAGSTTITVQAGDTLRGIAQRVYGNANLWYVLAEANSIGDDPLAAGTRLRVPEVKVTANDASTFKPFNPSEAIGNTSPGLPYIVPPPSGHHCSGLVNLLSLVVSYVVGAVVTVYAGPYAGAAAQGAVRAHSQQTFQAMADGQYDWGRLGRNLLQPFSGNKYDMFDPLGAPVNGGIDYRAVGVSSAVSVASVSVGKLGDTLQWGGSTAIAAQAATSYAANYQFSKWAGYDVSWNNRQFGTSVAAAMISQSAFSNSGVDTKGGTYSQVPSAAFSWRQVATAAMENVARSAVQYGVGKLVGAPDAHWNNGEVLVDAFGNALGSAAVGGIQRWQERRALDISKAQQQQLDNLNRDERNIYNENRQAGISHDEAISLARPAYVDSLANLDMRYALGANISNEGLAAMGLVLPGAFLPHPFDSTLEGVPRSTLRTFTYDGIEYQVDVQSELEVVLAQDGRSYTTRSLADEVIARGVGASNEMKDVLRFELRARGYRTGAVESELNPMLTIQQQRDLLVGDSDSAIEYLVAAATSYSASTDEMNALRRDLFTRGSITADVNRLGSMARTVQFSFAAGSTALAEGLGVSRAEARVKTDFDTYKGVMAAAIRTNGVQSIVFSGLWRPSNPLFQQYYGRDWVRHALAAGVEVNGRTGLPTWSTQHVRGSAIDVLSVNGIPMRRPQYTLDQFRQSTAFSFSRNLVAEGATNVRTPWLKYGPETNRLADPWQSNMNDRQHRMHFHVGF